MREWVRVALQEHDAETLTVEALRKALEALPGSAFVALEGCDCVGACSGVLMVDGRAVLLRPDGRMIPREQGASGDSGEIRVRPNLDVG